MKIRTLLGKEFHRLFFNPVVVAAIGIYLLALTLAAFNSVNSYKWNLRQYNSLVESSGEGAIKYFSANTATAPAPTQIIARGVSDILCRPIGIMRQINASFNMKYSIGLERRQKELIYSLVPDVDPLMVMRYLLALLAILFSFDQVCGERQKGTLQQTLSNPVTRRALLTAKVLAGLLTLAAIVVMSALIVSVILWAMDISVPSTELWRPAAIFLAAFLYGACFLGIGTVVSAVVRTSGVSILICLAAWCLLVVVAPGAITQLAEALSPVPPAHQIYQEKLSIERSLKGGEVMVEGTPLDEMRAFNQEKLNRIGKVEEDFHNLVLRQERLAQTLGLISPAVVFESVSTSFAGTGIAEEHEILAQLYRHFGDVAEKDDYEQELARRAQEADPKKRREESEKDELPVFKYRPLAAAELFTATLVQWAALFIVTIALFGCAYLLFNRYDVRTSG